MKPSRTRAGLELRAAMDLRKSQGKGSAIAIVRNIERGLLNLPWDKSEGTEGWHKLANDWVIGTETESPLSILLQHIQLSRIFNL